MPSTRWDDFVVVDEAFNSLTESKRGTETPIGLSFAIQQAMMGIAVPPLTRLRNGELACCCLRSLEFRSGCAICWAVGVGSTLNRGFLEVTEKIGENYGMSLGTIIQVLRNEASEIHGYEHLGEVYKRGRAFERYVRILRSCFSSENPINSLYTVYSKLCVIADEGDTSLSLVRRILNSVTSKALLRGLECSPIPTGIFEYDVVQKARVDELLRVRELVAANYPEVSLEISTITCPAHIAAPIGSHNIADEYGYESALEGCPVGTIAVKELHVDLQIITEKQNEWKALMSLIDSRCADLECRKSLGDSFISTEASEGDPRAIPQALSARNLSMQQLRHALDAEMDANRIREESEREIERLGQQRIGEKVSKREVLTEPEMERLQWRLARLTQGRPSVVPPEYQRQFGKRNAEAATAPESRQDPIETPEPVIESTYPLVVDALDETLFNYTDSVSVEQVSERLSDETSSGSVHSSPYINEPVPLEVFLYSQLDWIQGLTRAYERWSNLKNIGPYIDIVHAICFLHSGELSRALCEDVFTLGQQTSLPLVERINHCFSHISGIEWIHLTPVAEFKDVSTYNVYRALEGLTFSLTPKAPESIKFLLGTPDVLSKYLEVFRVIATCEFAHHTLTSCWKSVRGSKRTCFYWMNLRVHVSSLRDYLTVRVVAGHHGKLLRQLEMSKSAFAQKACLDNCISSIFRDALCMHSETLSLVLTVFRSATEFGAVVDRCARFDMVEEAMQDQLRPIMDAFEKAAKVLRMKLKKDIWSF